MMKLAYFTKEAYNKLLININKNVTKYSNDEDWLPEYFGDNNKYYKESTVEVGEFIPRYKVGKKTDPQKAAEDLENAIRLYKAFNNLTPFQAANKELWAYICHMPVNRQYIQDRWMGEQGKTEKKILERYFIKSRKELLRYNALSRLWWAVYLTYDNDNTKDHYWLTKILFSNQTIHADVMDTLNITNFTRVKGVLLAIGDFIKKNGETYAWWYVREANKYLNRYAAVTNMEFLDSEKIRKLAFDKMMELKTAGSIAQYLKKRVKKKRISAKKRKRKK